MRNLPPNKHDLGRRLLQVTLAVVIAVGIASIAVADTVYLKNGRVIRTPRAWVEGDVLRFVQYGQDASIPMTLVDRIVDDESRGPEPSGEPRTSGTDADDGTSAPDADGAGSDASPLERTEPAPEETREYWQGRVRENRDEHADLEESLTELRREERAFLFAHRSTAETRQRIEAVQQRLEELDEALIELRREARRAGIPPGWLRN